MIIGEFRIPHTKTIKSRQNCPGFIIACKNRMIVDHYSSELSRNCFFFFLTIQLSRGICEAYSSEFKIFVEYTSKIEIPSYVDTASGGPNHLFSHQLSSLY